MKRRRAWTVAAAGALSLGIVPAGLASNASAVPIDIPTASGAWGTLTMPLDFFPGYGTLNWFGADAAGNVYYVPSGGYTSTPQIRANARTSHGTLPSPGFGIERYSPETGQSTIIDASRDFQRMEGLAVEPSGNVDVIVFDTINSVWVVMRVSPTGQETVLNATIPGLGGFPTSGIAVDASGDVFVSVNDFFTGTATIYEVPSGGGDARLITSFAHDPVSGLTVAPNGTLYASSSPFGDGVLHAISPAGTTTNVPVYGGAAYGIAVDGAGNLYSGQTIPYLVQETSPSGSVQYLPPSPALALHGHTMPFLLAYGGGTLYMWDQSNAPPASGVRSSTFGPTNTLYTWTTAPSARPFLTSVDAVAARLTSRFSQSITATWTGGGPTYRCTLMSGYNSPTSFTVTTSSHSCTFYGLALGTSFGISVVSISGGVASAPEVGFAPAPRVTITCKLGKRTLHRTGLNPRCPLGWRQV